MFPTIVGAWVLDWGGRAGRSRFCYPKGQSRAAALMQDVGGVLVGGCCLGKDGIGVGERRDGDGRWMIGVETAIERRDGREQAGSRA
jgi:hypothetical protein